MAAEGKLPPLEQGSHVVHAAQSSQGALDNLGERFGKDSLGMPERRDTGQNPSERQTYLTLPET